MPCLGVSRWHRFSGQEPARVGAGHLLDSSFPGQTASSTLCSTQRPQTAPASHPQPDRCLSPPQGGAGTACGALRGSSGFSKSQLILRNGQVAVQGHHHLCGLMLLSRDCFFFSRGE